MGENNMVYEVSTTIGEVTPRVVKTQVPIQLLKNIYSSCWKDGRFQKIQAIKQLRENLKLPHGKTDHGSNNMGKICLRDAKNIIEDYQRLRENQTLCGPIEAVKESNIG